MKPQLAVILLMVAPLAACGGTGDSPNCQFGSPVNICLDEAHQGIWLGTASNSLVPQSSDIVVLVASDGEMRLLDIVGVDIVGFIQATTRGEVSGSVTAFAQSGFTFADGQTVATGTISGTANLVALDANWSLSTGDSGQFSAESAIRNFETTEPEDVAGTWSSVNENGVVTGTFTVDGQGIALGQNTSGCVYDGNVETSDSNIFTFSSNILRVQMDVSLCGQLDGTYSGLGSYERAGNDDPDAPDVDTIRIHINRPDLVLIERWERL